MEKDFLFVKSLDVRMKLLPLLSKEIRVRRFVVDGPRLTLEKNKAGHGNWEAWGVATPPAPAQPTAEVPLWSLAVGELTVRNGSVLYIDQASGSRQEVSDVSLGLRDVPMDRPIRFALSAVRDEVPISMEGSVGPVGPEPGKGKIPLDVSIRVFKELNADLKGHLQDPMDNLEFDVALAVDSFSPRKLWAAVKAPFPLDTAEPESLSRVSLSSRVRGNPQRVSLTDGVLDLDRSKVSFTAAAMDFSRPDLTFDMEVDEIDLDRYLPSSPGKAGDQTGRAGSKTDYTLLRRLVLNGKVRVGMLTAGGMKMRDVSLKVTGRDGVIELDPLVASLYKGTVSAVAALDMRQGAPRLNLALQARKVQAGSLLRDFIKKDFVEGTANAEVTISLAPDAPDGISRSMSGKGQAVLADGAIKGVDLAGMMRNLTSAFALVRKGGAGPSTEFVELNAPFTIARGVLTTSGTSLISPLLRVIATGRASLVDESLDLRVEPEFVGILKGQGDFLERSGIMVAVLVKGTFSSPSFQPDLRGILEKGLIEAVPGIGDLLKPLRIQGILKGLKGLTGQ